MKKVTSYWDLTRVCWTRSKRSSYAFYSTCFFQSISHFLIEFELIDKNHDGSPGETCNVKNNSYKPPADVLSAFPDGCRIDYILYKHNESNIFKPYLVKLKTDSFKCAFKEIHVDCLECKTCFSKIPEHSYLSYSDHEGVYGQFQISNANGIDLGFLFILFKFRSILCFLPIEEEKKEIKDKINAEIEHYLHAQEIIQINMRKLSKQQKIFIYLGLTCFLILSLFHFYFEPFDLVQNTILLLFLIVLFLYAVLSTRIEQRLLKSALESIRLSANTFHKNKWTIHKFYLFIYFIRFKREGERENMLFIKCNIYVTFYN